MQALRISIALSYQSSLWETVEIVLYISFTNTYGGGLVRLSVSQYFSLTRAIMPGTSMLGSCFSCERIRKEVSQGSWCSEMRVSESRWLPFLLLSSLSTFHPCHWSFPCIGPAQSGHPSPFTWPAPELSHIGRLWALSHQLLSAYAGWRPLDSWPAAWLKLSPFTPPATSWQLL